MTLAATDSSCAARERPAARFGPRSWDPVREAFASFLADSERFESFVSEQLAELTRLRDQLVKRQSHIEHREAQLEDQFGNLAHERQQVAAEQQALQAAQAELAQRQAELAERLAEIESQQSRDHGQLQERCDELAQRCETLAVQRDQAVTELAAVRAELAAHSDQLRAAVAGAAIDADGRLERAEREKHELELELEQLRNRTAEMAETYALERRRMAEERAEWAGELRQLRRVLEHQAMRVAEHEPGIAVGARRVAAEPAPAQPTNRDPVLDSVMSQFELLQKERARRRSRESVAAPAEAN